MKLRRHSMALLLAALFACNDGNDLDIVPSDAALPESELDAAGSTDAAADDAAEPDTGVLGPFDAANSDPDDASIEMMMSPDSGACLRLNGPRNACIAGACERPDEVCAFGQCYVCIHERPDAAPRDIGPRDSRPHEDRRDGSEDAEISTEDASEEADAGADDAGPPD